MHGTTTIYVLFLLLSVLDARKATKIKSQCQIRSERKIYPKDSREPRSIGMIDTEMTRNMEKTEIETRSTQLVLKTTN